MKGRDKQNNNKAEFTTDSPYMGSSHKECNSELRLWYNPFRNLITPEASFPKYSRKVTLDYNNDKLLRTRKLSTVSSVLDLAVSIYI